MRSTSDASPMQSSRSCGATPRAPDWGRCWAKSSPRPWTRSFGKRAQRMGRSRAALAMSCSWPWRSAACSVSWACGPRPPISALSAPQRMLRVSPSWQRNCCERCPTSCKVHSPRRRKRRSPTPRWCPTAPLARPWRTPWHRAVGSMAAARTSWPVDGSCPSGPVERAWVACSRDTLTRSSARRVAIPPGVRSSSRSFRSPSLSRHPRR
mmetsp:Transcript_28244/g.88004  ORF Transcript_28244/g.88004 Transcript_28244/m.88004 type:complete len:209 (-) Transcript_28244:506-1132(-)